MGIGSAGRRLLYFPQAPEEGIVERKGWTMRLLLLLANGFEEIEALGTLDLLRRGGLEVDVCAVGKALKVTGAHGITTEARLCVEEADAEAYEGVILPGGLGGTQTLAASAHVLALVREMDAQGKLVCAICAAPALVLPAAGVLRGRKVTCFPAPQFVEALGSHYVGGRVVVDGDLITGEGPGRFADFARAILSYAIGGHAAIDATMRDALFD